MLPDSLRYGPHVGLVVLEGTGRFGEVAVETANLVGQGGIHIVLELGGVEGDGCCS
jgi:hypothetical protein